jgi:hypothetical protein
MLALLFFCLSLAFLVHGIYRLKGPVSVWYLAHGLYAVYAGGLNYFSIPFGIVMALWALALSPFVPDGWKLWLFNIGTVGGFLGVILARFLKPRWLRWLEREHGKIVPLLRNEIQEMGYHEWDQRINTQRDLEQWVEEARRKHGW